MVYRSWRRRLICELFDFSLGIFLDVEGTNYVIISIIGSILMLDSQTVVYLSTSSYIYICYFIYILYVIMLLYGYKSEFFYSRTVDVVITTLVSYTICFILSLFLFLLIEWINTLGYFICLSIFDSHVSTNVLNPYHPPYFSSSFPCFNTNVSYSDLEITYRTPDINYYKITSDFLQATW